MRLDMNIFQIAAKYAANLMGIATPEEREALENWKQESVWHTNLAERLDQEEDFKENQQLLERFSVTEAWKKMEKNLDKAMGRRAGGEEVVEICCCHFSDVGRWILVFSDENSCARKAAPYCAAEYSFRKAKCKINLRKWKGGKACSGRSVYFGRDGWYCDSKGFYGD